MPPAWSTHYSLCMSIESAPQPVSVEQRREILQWVIGNELRGDTRVMHQADTWVVLASGQRANHVLHAILSLFLCGLWLPVWLVVGLTSGERRRTYWVDELGQVQVRWE